MDVFTMRTQAVAVLVVCAGISVAVVCCGLSVIGVTIEKVTVTVKEVGLE